MLRESGPLEHSMSALVFDQLADVRRVNWCEYVRTRYGLQSPDVCTEYRVAIDAKSQCHAVLGTWRLAQQYFSKSIRQHCLCCEPPCLAFQWIPSIMTCQFSQAPERDARWAMAAASSRRWWQISPSTDQRETRSSFQHVGRRCISRTDPLPQSRFKSVDSRRLKLAAAMAHGIYSSKQQQTRAPSFRRS